MGTSVAILNPDYVSDVRWWIHDDFADKDVRKAAEVIAAEILDPVLKSRRGPTDKAQGKLGEADFQTRMKSLFESQPAGHLKILTLKDALNKIDNLQDRILALEIRLRRLKAP